MQMCVKDTHALAGVRTAVSLSPCYTLREKRLSYEVDQSLSSTTSAVAAWRCAARSELMQSDFFA